MPCQEVRNTVGSAAFVNLCKKENESHGNIWKSPNASIFRSALCILISLLTWELGYQLLTLNRFPHLYFVFKCRHIHTYTHKKLYIYLKDTHVCMYIEV